jgi:hypothetical protein
VAYKMDECGGLAHLERLQTHGNIQVYKAAINIIVEYFGFEEEPMSDEVATTPSSIFTP